MKLKLKKVTLITYAKSISIETQVTTHEKAHSFANSFLKPNVSKSKKNSYK